jgi:hypothetical protein
MLAGSTTSKELALLKRLLIAAVLAIFAGTGAHAADGRVSARITGGTLGIGPEIGYRLSDNATFLSFSHDFSSDDIDYDGKAHLKSGGAMIDLFPFGGGFFVSGGARINGNDGRATATPTANVQVGRNTFTPAQIGTLSGDAETKNFAPSLTLGYSGSMRSGFVAGVEAGALFQGKVRVRNFRSSSNLIPAANLEQERLEVQDDVDDYKVYPILQLTLGYRF